MSRKTADRFHRSFRRVVTLKSAEEPCDWKKHFLYVPRDVVAFMESLPSMRTNSRFAHAGVEAMVEGINNGRLKVHKKPRHKRIVEYALAHLEKELGIGCRVTNMTFNEATYERGFLLEPHDHACRREGNRCEFIGGSLRDLFPANTEQVTRVEFYPLPSREEREAEIKRRLAERKQK